MTVLIETEDKVRDFILGALSPQDFEAWIIATLDDVSEAEQEALWDLRLLLTEYGENMRPLDDAKVRASQLLADLSVPPRSDSSSSTTERAYGIISQTSVTSAAA